MRRIRQIVALLFIQCTSLFAYNFYCNSVDVFGDIEGDSCDVCNVTSATRWIPADIPIRIDSILPPQLNQTQWEWLVQQAMDAWNNVPGARLHLHLVPGLATRVFGGNDSSHDVFWITDIDEWHAKIGGGEKGSLAMTLPRYRCPTQTHPAREIYDADMVLNGVGELPWAHESLLATMKHEFGHLLGLGHPCAKCEWSIMSAEAVDNLDALKPDDQAGVRALYSGG